MNALQAHDAELLTDCDWLIGIDEAGRGALAGPVVAGACILGRAFFESSQALELSALVNDSKQLGAEARTRYFALIKEMQAAGLVDFAVASGTVREIADLNILGATRFAMRRAVEALAERAQGWILPDVGSEGPLFAQATPVRVIVDGRPLKPFPYTHQGIIKGDGKSLCIAMASIAAKVTRDLELDRLAVRYPEYGFEAHKGYGTHQHRSAIRTHGPSSVHRELFLRKILES